MHPGASSPSLPETAWVVSSDPSRLMDSILHPVEIPAQSHPEVQAAMNIRMLTSLILLMTISKGGMGQTRPEAKAPGEQFLPPTPASAANGPVVFECSRELPLRILYPDCRGVSLVENLCPDLEGWRGSRSS